MDVRLDIVVYIRLCCSLLYLLPSSRKQLQVETTMAIQEDIQRLAVPTEVPTNSSEHDWVMMDGKIVMVRQTWDCYNELD